MRDGRPNIRDGHPQDTIWACNNSTWSPNRCSIGRKWVPIIYVHGRPQYSAWMPKAHKRGSPMRYTWMCIMRECACPKSRVVVHRMLLRGGSIPYVVAQSIKRGGSFCGCPKIVWWASEMRDFLGQTWRPTTYVTWMVTLALRGPMPHIAWMPRYDRVVAQNATRRGSP